MCCNVFDIRADSCHPVGGITSELVRRSDDKNVSSSRTARAPHLLVPSTFHGAVA